MFYGELVWDPWLIVDQIVCPQSLYYLTFGLFLSILVRSRVSWMKFRNTVVLREVKGMFYGALVWDPWLIVAQIVCLQCLYYLTLGLFLSILVGSRVSLMSLIYFFDYSTLTVATITGWYTIFSCLLSAVAGAGYMLHLIERAKKCLDFSATLYIIHFFICIIYGGWPSSITWWVVNGTGFAVMAFLGQWLCRRHELREIAITRLRSNV